ncbi:hypothetical protein P0D69_41505 [Paraburkholderia sediminicola]|uniref:hypothetical protein n=1 Tax=Paraburkholderia sediminicola TaxID=458836 RepID=UPI0038B75F9F
MPLPVAGARAVSLENHLALVAMRSGHGNPDVMSCLLKSVYLACFLHEAVHGHIGLEPFREAEGALTRCVMQAELSEEWLLPDDENTILARILTLHDQQLASMPAHLVTAARERLYRFIASDVGSPIPPERAA